jgi:HK97 family phage major capsid protein
MKITDLKLKINEYESRMKAITEGELSDELRTEFDGLVAKRDAARQDLKRAEAAEAINLEEVKRDVAPIEKSKIDKWADSFKRYVTEGVIDSEFRGENGGLIVPLELRADPLLTSTTAAIVNKTVGPVSVKAPAGLEWLQAMGATFDENLNGNYVLPSIASVTVGFVTEGGDSSTVSVAPAGNTLAARLLGGNQTISRQMLAQSNPDILAGVLKVIDLAMGEAIVKDAFTQTATDLTTARLQSTVVVAPDYTKMLQLDSSIAVAQLNPVFVMSKQAKNYLKQSNAGSANIKFAIADDDTLAGIPVFAHPSLTANRFYLIDAMDLHVGFWGQPELIVDQFTSKKSGKIEFQVLRQVDCGYANPASGVYYDSSTF